MADTPLSFSAADESFMRLALEQARAAGEDGEIPVGAVCVWDGRVISVGRNRREREKNALCHAELDAIGAACRELGGWRLWNCDLYVTLEPCPMCAGAIINARIRRVVYGAADPKAGSCGSVTDLFSLRYNHHPAAEGGCLERECSELLECCFRSIRANAVNQSYTFTPPTTELLRGLREWDGGEHAWLCGNAASESVRLCEFCGDAASEPERPSELRRIAIKGKTVGAVLLGMSGADGEAVVEYLVTDPSLRLRGHGSAALRDLREWLRERCGTNRISAAVPRGNETARRCFERAGFRPDVSAKPENGGAVRMTLEIAE